MRRDMHPNRPIGLFNFVRTVLIIFFATASSASAANNPIPSISAPLVPAAATPGGASFTLTVNGTGFTSTSVVNWNGSPRATTFVSSTRVTAAILAADIQSPATSSVTVTNSAPGGGSSAPLFFLVANPAPFTAAAAPLAGNPSASAQAVADLNHDGKQDIIYVGNPIGGGGSANSINILLGNGNGTFAQGACYPGPTASNATASQILTADFNNDGNLDILVEYAVNGGTAVDLLLLGNGDGTFQQPQTLSTTFTQAVAADFNGDGNLDLAGFEGLPDEKLQVWTGHGNGTFTAGYAFDFSSLGGGYQILGLTAGDVDNNGTLDLVVALGAQGSGNMELALLKGMGDGTFASPIAIFTGLGTPAAPALADLNADGNLDLVFASSPANLEVLLGHGDGTFSDFNSIPVTPAATASLLLQDFNGDGKLDINYGAQLFFGQGDGTFPASALLPSFNAPNSAVDFNGDGKLDILGLVGSTLTVATQQPAPTGDFTGTIDPQVLTVRAGAVGVYSLNVIPLGGFQSNVDLSVTGLPGFNGNSTPPMFEFTPSAIISGGSGSASLAVFTGSQTLPGTYNALITSTTPTTPSLFHTSLVQLVVLPFGPDFTGSLSDSNAFVESGQNATYGITLLPIDGFTGTVSFYVTNLPRNAEASFSPQQVTGGSGSTTLTISTRPHTRTGRYFPVLTGVSGDLSHSTTLILDVNAPADFTGGVTPFTQTVSRGSSVTFNGTVVPLTGFTGDVELRVSGLPEHVRADIDPRRITGGSGTYTLTIFAGRRATPGTYPITITGTSRHITHGTTITLVVQ